ncbi:MAG: reactive intermediate/imine deaminase [Candidatus Marinimicrobia bacterium]|nr:reactive intermediate/imine deaminase [Candidatus Neomarinimicrobiota bacterium]
MKIINTKKAPAAIGTYSQAVKIDKLVFTSGQIGLCPKNGVLVKGGFEKEAIQVLINLENVLLAAGSSMKNVVKINVYLKNLNDFSVLNKLFTSIFKMNKLPARSTVEVSDLPQKACVEIDAVGYLR